VSPLLPEGLKFPVNGTFSIEGDGIPTFRMRTNPTSHNSRLLFWNGIRGFEYASIRIFTHLVRDAEVFCDIGANIGYYSLLASAIRQKRICVYAFEPSPDIYEYLLDNAVLNGFDNIHALRFALADRVGTATFYSIENPRFAGFPMLTGDGGLDTTHSGSRSRRYFDVPVETLDDFLRSRGEDKVDLIKIDVEAAEPLTLRGARQTLDKARPFVQCELLPGRNEDEVQEILAPFDYAMFRVRADGLHRVKRLAYSDDRDFDFYFVPSEKISTVAKFIVRRSA
jgi:FkbM family methyltransferase